MEQTLAGKRDAPDVDNASNDDNKGATTNPLSKRIRSSSSTSSTNYSQLPSVNELLSRDPDFSSESFSTKSRGFVLNAVCSFVADDPGWRKALDFALPGTKGSCDTYAKNNNELSMCIDMCVKTKDWDPLFSLLREYCRNTRKPRWRRTNEALVYGIPEKVATELAWKVKFKGEALMALDDHVKKHFNEEDSYANFCAIIQSSGMGKSRLVDEFGRTHIVIPVNIRSADSTGYPPGDTPVVKYFEDAGLDITMFQSNRLLCYFLTALLNNTMDTFKTPSAKELHQFFNEGMTFEEHGEKRQVFYENVVFNASRKLKEHEDTWNNKNEKLLYDAEAMKEFHLTLGKFLNVIKTSDPEAPKAFFSFDEAHNFSLPMKAHIDRTHMMQLYRILESVKDEPFFAFFISTTGKISSMISSRYPDASARVSSGQRKLLPPLTDVGYDHFAKENKIGYATLWLAQVVQIPFMANFGRPLWATRSNNLEDKKKEVLSFAKMKLLNADNPPKLTDDQKLACLSQRLALEYNTKNYLHVDQELTQVEGHLRVLRYIDEGAESVKSVSPSEPLVAEAAAIAMKNFNVAEAMKSVLEDFPINQGDRGELLVMLLLILARDAAILENPSILHIPNLIRQLFQQADSVLNMQPTISSEGSRSNILFKDMFKNAGTHFNHFIKVQKQRLCSLSELLALMFRGAFVLCADNTPGIDLCGAGVLDIDKPIDKNNSFVFMGQAKDDPKYTTLPVIELFDKMDPVKVSILKNTDAKFNIPVIRIVFALASPETALIPMPPRTIPGNKFTCYDIWCAGLSPEIYCSVAGHQATWKGLLNSSRRSQNIHKGPAKTLRQQQNPGAVDKAGHWDQWILYKKVKRGQPGEPIIRSV